ncbi:MAG: AAA family ATPase, partial [Clostridiales bacterium]|nr:AAA family ATPase [Clostridiales bacterium]
MELLGGLFIGAQFIFIIIAGLYFYTSLKTQNAPKKVVRLESKKETDKLAELRRIKLTEPLSEKTRPETMAEIIGQEKGLRALRAALCGPNPQHVILYGPPGVGKTAAARLVLEEARKTAASPFGSEAPFIEMDATILQFDERSIADPLIGSVHDPIYQGAGAYGNAGVPSVKPGAVTKAHGGVLFLDEIGELHYVQMNKLLKVLEDRKVFLTSSYYSEENTDIPRHIHDAFLGGLPADFRLIGATTRSPEELPPALRSRCTEVFFRRLNNQEVITIARNALSKTDYDYDEAVPGMIAQYAENGRDTVNIVQTSASLATLENRLIIRSSDVEDVIEYGRYAPKPKKHATQTSKIGVANGLAVYGTDSGALLEIEAVAEKRVPGGVTVTGIVEEEELSAGARKMRRTSTEKNSVENGITVLNKIIGVPTSAYHIHVNFPGGAPIDGPSAGIAIFTAIYSAI